MKKTLLLLTCAATYQASYAMNQIVPQMDRQALENKINGRKFTFIDQKTNLNYNKVNGEVFHNPIELDPLLKEEMADCACITAGATCFGIGALLHQPLCWMAGAAVVISKMPHFCEVSQELEEHMQYILYTKELEHSLMQEIYKEKKSL